MRLGVDSHDARGPGARSTQLAAELGDALGARAARRRPVERGRTSQRSASASRVCATELVGVCDRPRRGALDALADYLVKKSVWIVGGDGWAYDIGFGGLDHVLASHRDVNILVLDTEVYSNTGGQQSKATPLGAVAKFAAAGKAIAEEGPRPAGHDVRHTSTSRASPSAPRMRRPSQAFQRGRGYPGPSLIIAYSHCIAHGYDLAHGAEQQKLAVDSGVWPLYRFDPRRPRRRGRRCISTTDRRRRGSPTTCATKSRFRVVERTIPSDSKSSCGSRRRARTERYSAVRATGRREVPPGDAGAMPRPPRADRTEEWPWICARRISDFPLPHPLIPGASPLSDELDGVRRLEDAGARGDRPAVAVRGTDRAGTDGRTRASRRPRRVRSPRRPATSQAPMRSSWAPTSISNISSREGAVHVPVIASLNGTTAGGWLEYARSDGAGGADAIELNVYRVATRLDVTGAEIERQTIDVVASREARGPIPIAVKLSPSYTALGHMAAQIDRAGADGLVLFNRFYQPDLDIEELAVSPTLHLSSSAELLPRLHWTAILSGRIQCSLAVTGGVHTAEDIIKATMAGAHATQVVSALLMNGPQDSAR